MKEHISFLKSKDFDLIFKEVNVKNLCDYKSLLSNSFINLRTMNN